MVHFKCQCGNTLFFENSTCLKCGAEVAYDPISSSMVQIVANGPFRRCQNGIRHFVCNWVANGPDAFCKSCALNRTIPDLAFTANVESWRKVEIAKRRVLYTLFELGLEPPKLADDRANGLAFDILSPTTAPVLTGYASGIVTLNLNEANDAERERQRGILAEPYRTVMGHFRHESAHYFWDRFFRGAPDDTPELISFRELFGDERSDYTTALNRHYSKGPKSGWDLEYISSYASVHPCEDWAECWAHYMHVIDGTETARNFGLNSEAVPIPFTRFPLEAAELPGNLKQDKAEERRFLDVLHAWAKLSPALNEAAASMGHGTLYPFVFSLKIIRKLCFVHYMITKGKPLLKGGEPVTAPTKEARPRMPWRLFHKN